MATRRLILKNRAAFSLLAAMLVAACGGERSAPVAAKAAGPKFDWTSQKLLGVVAQVNAADLDERCTADRNVFPIAAYPAVFQAKSVVQSSYSDPDLYAIDVVLQGTMRTFPYPEIVYFSQALDYYERREELQKKTEARLAALEGDTAKDRSGKKDFALRGPKAKGHANYAMLLVYLGEWRKVADYYGSGGPEAARGAEDPEVAFAVAQALFRLGRYEEALPFAKTAYRKLGGGEVGAIRLDAKWQVMTIELGLYGKDLYKYYSKDIYDVSNVRKIFPTDDWSALPFEDVTEQLGVARWGGTGSVSWADMDSDGWDDLIWERKFFPPAIYRNNEGRALEDIGSRIGVDKCTPVIYTPADYDGDGNRDLFRHCCNYDGPGPMYLLHNDGNMTFTDVAAKAGLDASKLQGPMTGSGMAVSWGDYDFDGHIDLLVGDQWGPTRLYRNKGDGTFEEVSKEAGISTPGGRRSEGGDEFGAVGVSFGDFDNDRWPDIWMQGWGWNRLYRNRGDGTFEDVGKAAGIDDGTSKKGYMSFLVDFDSDGDLDLFRGSYVVSSDSKWGFSPVCTCSNLLTKEGYAEREWHSASAIFRNDGNGKFTDIGSINRFVPFGTMGSNAGDWDNDGYPDVVLGAGGPYIQQAEPFLFYRNNGGDGTFTNLTPFTMFSLWGKGHGSAFGDYDRDGKLDLVLNNGGAAPGDIWPSMVLRNTSNNGNHWIQIRLVPGLPGTNPDALHAKVRVYAGNLSQVQSLESGGRFAATNSFVLHFGLAKNAKIDRIVVEWPNRKMNVTELKDLAVDQAIEIRERDGSWATIWKPGPSSAKVVVAEVNR